MTGSTFRIVVRSMVMILKIKNMNKRAARGLLTIGVLGAGLSLALGGCASGNYASAGDWDWTPAPRLQAGNNGSSAAVVVSPGQDAQYYSYAYGQSPEFDRRDGSLNIRTNDPYAGWMEFQQVQRPSLENQRSYYISNSPYQYRYPSASGSYQRNYYYKQSSTTYSTSTTIRRQNNMYQSQGH